MFGQQPVGGNKQVCSFYLKGNCKYGTRCWNLHTQNPGGGGMSSTFASGGGANVFGQKTNAPQDTKDFNEFVKQVSGEMSQWERSGQWLLSSFAPLKSRPPIAGFSDNSPEEQRLQAYEALKSNTSQTYQTQWNELQQRFKQLREALKASTPEATMALREVFQAKGGDQGQPQPNTTSLLGNPPTQPLFGGTTGSTSNSPGLLGAKPQNSVFGGTSSMFGGNQNNSSMFASGGNKSAFGGQAPIGQNTFGTQQNQNTFGGGNNNVFAAAAAATAPTNTPTSNSLFGGNAQTQLGTSPLFGGSSNSNTAFGGSQTQNNIFNRPAQTQQTPFGSGGSSSPSVFGAPQGTGMFGGSNPATQNSGGNQPVLFGGQQTQQNTLFGKPAGSTPNVFGGASTPATSTSSVFGGSSMTETVTQTSGSLFGGTPSAAPGAQTASPSVFGGGTGQSTGSVFGGNASANPSSGGMGMFGGSTAPSPFSQQSDKPSLLGAFPSNTGQTPAPGLFGNPPQNQPGAGSQTPLPGLFGNPPQNQPAAGSGLLPTPPVSQMLPGFKGSTETNQNPNIRAGTKADWYTRLDHLSAEDRAQFEANTFTALPLCAPPIELCF